MTHLQVKKLHPEAKIPSRAHLDDAGVDLYSVETIVLKPGDRAGVKTGIAVAIPSGFVGLVWDKSGLALKSGITIMGGVIDAGYRGEIQVIVKNLGDEDVAIEVGHKIAQLLIQKVELCEVEEVDELGEADRGENGFGSTGKF
ncbi:MAG: dUTP diphosphatase [Candidatus Moranbacteria bacterium]|nr:dUTP diphosphatase [Candidatus Moranbacteria bacterium]